MAANLACGNCGLGSDGAVEGLWACKCTAWDVCSLCQTSYSVVSTGCKEAWEQPVSEAAVADNCASIVPRLRASHKLSKLVSRTGAVRQ